MKLVLSAVAIASLCAAPVWAQSDKSKNTETHDTRPEPPMLGKHLAKGQAKPDTGAGRRSPNLVYHSGPVMTSGAVVRTIFWGTSWTAADPKVTGLATFYGGVGGSDYIGSNSEYTQTGGTHVGTTVTYQGALIDTKAAPTKAPATSTIQTEVCSALSAAHVTPVTNGYYPVYVTTKRGSAGYCAWHSWGSCAGVNIQFAFFFNLDGDAGCDPGDTSTNHPQGVAALANVSGHELSEALTDPRGNGWYDAQGAENSDKCAWTFGAPFVTFKNNSVWKVQGNWSNLAYNNGQGYVDGSLVRGCIEGENP